MKAIEFHSRINSDQTLSIPPYARALLAGHEEARVMLLLPDVNEDQAWEQVTAETFLQGYADGDAIYDELPGS